MRVLFVTPECAPLTKTGGLGDVSAALPAALRALGHDVRILVPGYRAVLEGLLQLRPTGTLELLGFKASVLEARNFFVLDCAELYRRDGGPYQDASGNDWPDNPLRFGLLARAAALVARDWQADILHCNDWPTGLSPVYLSGKARSVMTVHNLAFQGNFDALWVQRLGLPVESFTMEGAEFHGQLSFLKAGLAYADAITTVSPTYAREIQGAELGFGMDGLLRHRAAALTGILNGIDTDIWDPGRDEKIKERYGASSLEKKLVNKTELQRLLGLEVRADVPLFGVVSRLTYQKGTDLVAAVAEALVAIPAQLAVLGAGNRDQEETLSHLKTRFPGKIGLQIGFDEGLAHRPEHAQRLGRLRAHVTKSQDVRHEQERVQHGVCDQRAGDLARGMWRHDLGDRERVIDDPWLTSDLGRDPARERRDPARERHERKRAHDQWPGHGAAARCPCGRPRDRDHE